MLRYWKHREILEYKGGPQDKQETLACYKANGMATSSVIGCL